MFRLPNVLYKRKFRLVAIWLSFTSLVLISCNLLSVIWTPAPEPAARSPGLLTVTPTTSFPIQTTPAVVPVTEETSPLVNLNRRLVGYFTSWSIYARGYHAKNIPVDLLTHIYYAFTIISDEGVCAAGDAHADQINIPELQELKQNNPQLR